MIYLDNSATSYPKPRSVIEAVDTALTRYGANPGRSGHSMSANTARAVYKARENLSSFFHMPNIENVIFTPSCTYALNTVIKGVLKKGDHAVISSLEHNAVSRPLEALKQKGMITYSVADVYEGDNDRTVDSFRRCINERTRLIVCTHASNVFGIRLPVERICALAHQYHILFCLDAAQSGGVLELDIGRDRYDFVCLAGHKGLYAPMGMGALLINSGETLGTLMEGGTGSESSSLSQPEFYPDRMESGTLNIPGICGMNAGVDFIRKIGRERILRKEMKHIQTVYNSLKEIKNIKLYTDYPDESFYAPVLSFSVEEKDSESVARYLNEKYHIAVRAGLHCAPLAHRSKGSDAYGTVRISPSFFTTENDIMTLQKAVYNFSKFS